MIGQTLKTPGEPDLLVIAEQGHDWVVREATAEGSTPRLLSPEEARAHGLTPPVPITDQWRAAQVDPERFDRLRAESVARATAEAQDHIENDPTPEEVFGTPGGAREVARRGAAQMREFFEGIR